MTLLSNISENSDHPVTFADDDFKGTYEIFQNPEFADIFAKLNGLKRVDLDGLQVLIRKGRFLGNVTGLVGSPELIYPKGEWVDKLESLDCAYVDVHTTSALPGLEKFRFSADDNVNLYIDLTRGHDETLERIRKSCKKTIRAAESNKVYFREAESEDDIKEYDRIIRSVSQDGKLFPIFSWTFVEQIVRTPFAKIVLVCHEGKIIGGDLIFTGRNATVWSGGHEKKFTYLCPGHYLTWEGILWSMRRGHKYYDLGQQSLTGMSGSAEYKKSFGTRMKPAYAYRIVQSRAKKAVLDLRTPPECWKEKVILSTGDIQAENVVKKPEEFGGTYEIFQDADFAERFAAAHGLKVERIGKGLLLVARSRIPGLTWGILNSPEAAGVTEAELLEKFRELRLTSLKIHTCLDIPHLREYCTSPADNYIMLFDLQQGSELLLKNFSRNCQKAIRAGERKGVTVEYTQSEGDMHRIHEIACATSESGRKFDVPHLTFLRDLVRTPFCEMIVARHEGNVIGGYFLLLTNNAFGWAGGIDKSYRALTPGNLMLFKTMEWAIDNGYRYFNIGDQSLNSNPALTKFKMSFNPMLVKAYQYDVPLSPVKHMLMQAVQKVRG